MKKQILGLALGAVAGAGLLVACGNDGTGNLPSGSTYSGTAEGVSGPLTANITISEGEITWVSFDHSDTADIVNPVLDTISETLINSQNGAMITEDTIAGATPTGKAAMDAIRDALVSANFPNPGAGSSTLGGAYESGGTTVTYGNTNSSVSQSIIVPGVHGDMEVTAFIENYELVGLSVYHQDTADIVNPVFEGLLSEIVNTNIISYVSPDVYAGATPSAEAVINAMFLIEQIAPVNLD